MRVNDFNIIGTCAGPTKAEPELVIDPNTVQTGPIAFQRFESVTRRNPQVIKTGRDLKLSQLPKGYSLKRDESANALSTCQFRRVTTFERSDHGSQ